MNPGKYTTEEFSKIPDRQEITRFAYDQFSSTGVSGLSGNFLHDTNCDKVNYYWNIRVYFYIQSTINITAII